MDALYTNGPAGGGGAWARAEPVIAIASAPIERDLACLALIWGGILMQLRQLAHSRTGDKGDIANISVIAHDAADYGLLPRAVTIDRVSAHFVGIVAGRVERYEPPNLAALNFALHRALGGGVARSLALDVHGKCLSSYLLALEIDAGVEEPR